MNCCEIGWFEESPRRGLAAAGRDYLRHLLSAEQLALYRVVTRYEYEYPDSTQYCRGHATAEAILKIVDSEDPPLRFAVGARGPAYGAYRLC
jgi:hypothetical protein